MEGSPCRGGVFSYSIHMSFSASFHTFLTGPSRVEDGFHSVKELLDRNPSLGACYCLCDLALRGCS